MLIEFDTNETLGPGKVQNVDDTELVVVFTNLRQNIWATQQGPKS